MTMVILVNSKMVVIHYDPLLAASFVSADYIAQNNMLAPSLVFSTPVTFRWPFFAYTTIVPFLVVDILPVGFVVGTDFVANCQHSAMLHIINELPRTSCDPCLRGILSSLNNVASCADTSSSAMRTLLPNWSPVDVAQPPSSSSRTYFQDTHPTLPSSSCRTPLPVNDDIYRDS
ncbi:hypothetical protein F5051DRAFT_450992, partial [Lentinula edodes]